MKRSRLFLLLASCLGLLPLAGTVVGDRSSLQDLRQLAQKQLSDGNYKDAYENFRKLALDRDTDSRRVGGDLQTATSCLQNLGRVSEVDAFREQVIDLHADNWRLLQAAAENYLNLPHYGYIVAGEFHRGDKRGGGRVVNVAARDRVRALQLMVRALPLANEDNERGAVGNFYLALARMLLNNRGYSEAWRLQSLTDLSELPDHDAGWYYGRRNQGAPVDADGNPVFYSVPESFEAATNDGERWRWAMTEAAKVSPHLQDTVRWQFAEFLHNQFGVQTMAYFGYRFGGGMDHEEGDETGTYALHTLEEDETIARLATGIRRLKLPDEFNFIKLFQQLAAAPNGGYGESALNTLAQVFENRRQYPKAADYWRRSIERHGPGSNNHKQKRLDQIVKNWARFEGTGVQPAGQGASIELRFRNGQRVDFEAREIDVDRLLADVKAYLKSNRQQIDWQKVNLGDIGHRIVQQDQQKYVGRRVATWQQKLEPRANHFDRRITVTTPLSDAGAYFITAKMVDGNVSRVILWVSDTVILKKPLSEKTYYFVADAVTGKPIEKANVEFFGYQHKRLGRKRYQTLTTHFAEFTDADGQVILPIDPDKDRYQWLITARTGTGRLAYLGFTSMWRGRYYDVEYNATKVFTITDRPVYRPQQAVKFKFWVRHARYDQEETSDFANRQFTVVIRNPKGDKVLEKQCTSDAYGGIEGQYELPEDATLGVYQLTVQNLGGGRFRVEEYKKPEFEVTVDAPTEPVMLGEKITATIRANYYFGSPVTEAKVKYKITRTSHDDRWYPVADWDWLYGSGYWWFGYDYTWYPGWERWGCKRPLAPWWGFSRQPPEVVAEAEVRIGPDGTFTVEIDTSVAKEIHGDQDHRYTITAEVVDASRRTIVGTGNVLVARKPFKVFAWGNRGYYRVGDTVRASFSAHTLDQKPVEGTGKLTLYAITYDEERQPVETVVREWDLDTDAQGKATQQLTASAAGQYRLSYELTDRKGHTIEGGYLFTVIGAGFEGSAFRFNHVELIPEKREYQPGETVRLQVNTDRVGSTVLVFVRPANGVYLPPRVVRLEGKSTVVEIGVVKKDMPNFFVEAVTVADAKLHTETKELVVPPEKRVLNVAIEPSSNIYKPGEEAEVKFTLTDFHGEPFVGSAVVTIYDKAVEYISGGSNVQEIKAFFWKWRRQHHPRTESNLGRFFYNLVKPGETAMGDLGVFGGTVADELREDDRLNMFFGDKAMRRGRELQKGAGVMIGGRGRMEAAADMAAPMSAALESEEAPAGPARVVPTVRTEFADTALWRSSITTGSDGTAIVKLTMPENLTTWKVRVWGMGPGTKVGQGETEVITRKNVIVRLQAPRFFVEKDEVVLSANVHNYLDVAKDFDVLLELEGGTLTPMGATSSTVRIEAGGEARVDWRVKVTAEGEAIVRVKALTDVESDATEMRLPVYVHGMLKTDSFAGALRPEEGRGRFEITVPAERRPEQSRLEVRYSPTLAGAMVDALPYLVSFPYGCTEQTLNRFLPTVVTQRILLEMGLDLEAIREKRTNLNTQEIGDDRDRAKGWQRYPHNPVFDEKEVERMVKQGVQALTDMQLSDGGWGWFSGYGEHSYPHTTATVVHGLQIAQQNDVALVPGMLKRGVEWLGRYQDEQVRKLKNAATKTKPYRDRADNLDALVYMVLVDADVADDAMLGSLYRDRTHLAVYSKALFGLALEKQGEREKLAMILRNLSQYVVEDDENQTAYLKLPADNYWWYWYGSENEAMAYYLKLLSRTDPKGRLASRLVKYLLNNRKHATYWNSTRDTALCIEAVADYLKATGEHKPNMVVEVWLDGVKQKEVEITSENLFTFDNTFLLTSEEVTTGVHTVELRKRSLTLAASKRDARKSEPRAQASGPLYFNAYLTYFTLEDHIRSAGLEIKVNRKYYKLTRVDKEVDVRGSRGQAVGQRVEKYERHEIPNLGTLTSGDLVEIELEIDSKNDYEYLMFEDMNAAGFEPVEVRSGYTPALPGAYMELRDNRVTFFLARVARGKHSVAYRMRAEIPGRFSALPTKASAMYAPELRANSEEIKVRVVD